MYTYSQIVPEALQGELIHLGDTTTLISWRVGDICQEVLVFTIQNRMPVDREEIYKAVGAFCGKAARTVREYAQLSRLFMPEIREVYAVLKHDHFRTASRYEDPNAILQWAVEQTDTLGRPATVDMIEAHFGGGWTQLPPEPPMPDNQDEAESETERPAKSPLARLADALRQIERSKEELRLSPSQAKEFDYAIGILLDIVSSALSKLLDRRE